MADPRFHKNAGPFTLGALAERTGAEVVGTEDMSLEIADVGALSEAGAEQISFLDNKKYEKAFAESKAGFCIVAPQYVEKAPAGMILLVTPQPYKAYAFVAQAFYPAPRPEAAIHAAATIAETASLGQNVVIQAGAVIGENVEIGDGSVIGPNAVLSDGVVIGADCRIGANAVISHCLMGDRVTIYRGAAIGQDGFGFASDHTGHHKIPQLGRVIIGNDVEIGANTTIDRGAGPDTVIGDGCFIDNLVQIGHNAKLGRFCVLVSQVGVSGSTTLGDFVVMGGQSGSAGHLNIGMGVQIAAKSGVTKDLAPGQIYGGFPALPVKDWRRQQATLNRLSKKKK